MTTSERLHTLLREFRNEQLPALQQAAATGDTIACFALGALYANGRGVRTDAQQARHWLRQAAEQGDSGAQTLLGWLYLSGAGGESDRHQARYWYSRAAASGDADAQCALGDLHYNAGQPIDATAMLQWYQRAAQQHHPKAQYQLGQLLAEGVLVAADDEAAFQWLTLAVMNESEPARKALQMLTARLSPSTLERYKAQMRQQFQMTH